MVPGVIILKSLKSVHPQPQPVEPLPSDLCREWRSKRYLLLVIRTITCYEEQLLGYLFRS